MRTVIRMLSRNRMVVLFFVAGTVLLFLGLWRHKCSRETKRLEMALGFHTSDVVKCEYGLVFAGSRSFVVESNQAVTFAEKFSGILRDNCKSVSIDVFELTPTYTLTIFCKNDLWKYKIGSTPIDGHVEYHAGKAKGTIFLDEHGAMLIISLLEEATEKVQNSN